jgi:hypothetical protein
MSQLVVLAQGPTVKVGWAIFLLGFLLAVTVVVTVPPSVEQAQVEIRKSTVPPGCTLLSEAAMVTKGVVFAVVGDGLGEDDDGVAVGVKVGVDEGDPVGVKVGVDEGVAELDTQGELDALGELDTLGDLDKAMLVMPVAPTNRPVATPIMTGPECASRMCTPFTITEVPIRCQNGVFFHPQIPHLGFAVSETATACC